MEKLSKGIVKLRIFFIVFWSILLVASLVMFFFVEINYDTTKYLPGDSDTLISLKKMEEEFGVINGQANVMIKGIEIDEALRYKQRMASVDGILEVMWVDTFITSVDFEEVLGIDVNEFLDFLNLNDQEVLVQIINGLIMFDSFGDFQDSSGFDKIIDAIINQFPGDFNLSALFTDIQKLLDVKGFYNNDKKSALFQVMFEEDQYSLKTGESIEKLRLLISTLEHDGFAMSGPAINSHYTRTLTSDEVFKITLYVIPIILIILFLFTNSWIEPLIFLIVIAVTVLINMGTNLMFDDISFLTQSTASLLQLAVTMDYAIFLLHRYTNYRDEGFDKKDAMVKALSKSFLPISSSMLTTAAGFAALIFMRYTIGADLAYVMIKGISLSIIAVFTLMPALIILFDNLLIKTKHRPFYPTLKSLVKPIFKLRFLIPALILILIIPVFNTQQNNHFLYGESAMSAGEGTLAKEEMDDIINIFGKSNQLVILIDNKTNPLYEKQLLDKLETDLKKYNPKIMALATMPSYMTDYIPDAFKDQLVGDNYNRIIIDIATGDEDKDAFDAIDKISQALNNYYNSNEYFVVGGSVAVKEIKNTVEQDFIIINLLSIGLVFIILLISFKSLLIPILLVLVIQFSVWANMSIPYLTDKPLIFIGYIIVSSVQLGATIDYGILLTQNYLNLRQTNTKKQSFKEAIISSSPSILTSGLILASAGYALFFLSSIEGVSGLGELIGRGALFSTFLVLFLLPQLLYLFDHLIRKTTKNTNFLIERELASYTYNENQDLVFIVETKVENLYSLEIEHLLLDYLPQFKLFADPNSDYSELEKKYDIIASFNINKWELIFKKDGKAYNAIKENATNRFSLYYKITSKSENLNEEVFLMDEIEKANHLNIYNVIIDDLHYSVFENEKLTEAIFDQSKDYFVNEEIFDYKLPITKDLTISSKDKVFSIIDDLEIDEINYQEENIESTDNINNSDE